MILRRSHFYIAIGIYFFIVATATAGGASFGFKQRGVFFVKEVPVLCYHNFRENRNTLITLSRQTFQEQIKLLFESGYTSVSPEQLYNHLTAGTKLPPKPIMISFDDARGAQYSIAAPILEKYGFRGVFFIMTVCINKPGYLSAQQIKDLYRRGHIIAAHSYDHPYLTKLSSSEWGSELRKPKKLLESVIQHPVLYFEYPYGAWSPRAVTEVKLAGYKAAFQLDGKHMASTNVFTIRRLMVEGSWSLKVFHQHIATTFR